LSKKIVFYIRLWIKNFRITAKEAKKIQLASYMSKEGGLDPKIRIGTKLSPASKNFFLTLFYQDFLLKFLSLSKKHLSVKKGPVYYWGVDAM
jgi:hypothetical protein